MPTDQDLFVEERSMVTMSLGDHIEELRRHLILALLGLIVGVVVTLIPPLNLGRQIVRQLQEPAQRTLGAFNAKQCMKRPRPPRLPALTRWSPHVYRPKHLPEPSARSSPTCPPPQPTP